MPNQSFLFKIEQFIIIQIKQTHGVLGFWGFGVLVKHLYDAMDSEDDPIANY